jgi:hypothetical protein
MQTRHFEGHIFQIIPWFTNQNFCDFRTGFAEWPPLQSDRDIQKGNRGEIKGLITGTENSDGIHIS